MVSRRPLLRAALQGTRNLMVLLMLLGLLHSIRLFAGNTRRRAARIEAEAAGFHWCEALGESHPIGNTTRQLSSIHGLGLFAASPIACGAVVSQLLGPDSSRTSTTSGLINHCHRPNVRIDWTRSMGWIIFALRDLRPGEELVADYLDAPWFIATPRPWWPAAPLTCGIPSVS